jgi:hypothetical protein
MPEWNWSREWPSEDWADRIVETPALIVNASTSLPIASTAHQILGEMKG